MTPQEFRVYAHQFVDWMADYMAEVESYPVRAPVKPGAIAAKLPDAAPETAEPMERIFADFQRDVMPGVTHFPVPSMTVASAGGVTFVPTATIVP